MIDHLDHLVLTTAHEAECIRFYTEVLSWRADQPPSLRWRALISFSSMRRRKPSV